MSTDPKEVFISELDKEIKWEWHWEWWNRNAYLTFHWALWFVRFFLLGFAAYQLNIGKNNLYYQVSLSAIVVLVIALLSTFNIALPMLSSSLKSQQRQEVHDRNARGLSIIRIELLTSTISLETAVQRFKEIRSQPVEDTIRNTP